MADPHYDALADPTSTDEVLATPAAGFWDPVAEFGYDAGVGAAIQDGQEFRRGLAIGQARGQATGYDQAVQELGRFDEGFKRGYLAGQASVPRGSDSIPPTITIISPIPGATIGPGTPLVFRYVDDTALRRPMPCIKIKQPDNTYKYELIHDGDNFTPDYQGTKTTISSNTFEYSVTRKGGWTASITYAGVSGSDPLQLVPFGTDQAGNEVA